LVLEPKDRKRGRELTLEEMVNRNCNRLVQVMHDANTDGQGSFFRFDVTVLRATQTRRPDGRTDLKVDQIYEKRYRYPRTPETLITFSPRAFADRAFSELEATGALEDIRR
jgi:hypothetical protein